MTHITKSTSNFLRRKALKRDSFNYKVFRALAKALELSAYGMLRAGQAYIDLFCGLDTYSGMQRFYGIYHSKKEDRVYWARKEEERKIKKSIKDLEKRKYIKFDRNKNLYLTEKGVLEFIKFRIEKKQKKWDKKWRIIIFDVAEDRRNSRDFLRSRLKWLGFKELQKSAWIFPYDIQREIEELMKISKYDAEGDVRFLIVEKIKSDDDLKKWFDL